MLVLTRNVGESIMIQDSIKILICEVDVRGQVKLGIAAPKSMAVHREEVYMRLQNKENQEHKK